MKVWKMISLLKQVIFRFQPFIFPGCIRCQSDFNDLIAAKVQLNPEAQGQLTREGSRDFAGLRKGGGNKKNIPVFPIFHGKMRKQHSSSKF